MNRSVARCLFVLILLFFSLLVFYRLNEQGLLYHDAGVYLLETKFLDEGFQTLMTLKSGAARNSRFWEEIKANTSGVPLHSGKPGLNVILWIASKGVGFTDTLSAKVTASAAVINLILTFLIARKLGTLRSALYSTAVLASSVFYLAYARSGLAEQVVTLFFLAGLLLYIRSRSKTSGFTAYAVGACMGYAFTANPWRVGYMLALVILLDFLTVWLEKKWTGRVFLRRVTLTLLGFVTPIVMFQAPFWAVKRATPSLPFPDYWTHLAEKLRWIGGVVWFQRNGELARQFWIVEGPFFPAVVLGGWILLLIRFRNKGNFRDSFLLIFSLIPFLFFSVANPRSATEPRVVSSLIPIAALAAGEFIESVQRRIQESFKFLQKYEGILAVIFVTVILAQAFPRQIKLGLTRSGYPEASRYLKSTGEKKFMILGMEPVWRFYLGRVAYEPYNRPATMKELVEKAQAENIKYVLVDFSTLHSKHGGDFTASFLGRETPVAAFPNPRGTSLPYLLDLYGLEMARRVTQDPASDKIYIFDIKDTARSLEK